MYSTSNSVLNEGNSNLQPWGGNQLRGIFFEKKKFHTGEGQLVFIPRFFLRKTVKNGKKKRKQIGFHKASGRPERW